MRIVVSIIAGFCIGSGIQSTVSSLDPTGPAVSATGIALFILGSYIIPKPKGETE